MEKTGLRKWLIKIKEKKVWNEIKITATIYSNERAFKFEYILAVKES